MTELAAILPFLSGLIYAGFGYAVARAKNGEPFEPKNFFTTAAIGAGLAGIAYAANVDLATAEGFTAVQLLTIVADKLGGLLFTKKQEE